MCIRNRYESIDPGAIMHLVRRADINIDTVEEEKSAAYNPVNVDVRVGRCPFGVEDDHLAKVARPAHRRAHSKRQWLCAVGKKVESSAHW